MNDFKGDTPRPKDKVRVTFDAEFTGEAHDDWPARIKVVKGGKATLMSIPDGASVEVLERADDPAKDKLGTLRREAHDDALVIYMKTTVDANGWWTAVYSNAAGIIGKRFDNEFVAEFPIFDVCPGTPAAEAEKPEYPEVSGAGVPFPPSESAPGQDLCRQDECPAAPRCSSGATVWHTRTPECTPPLHVDNEAIVRGEYYGEKAATASTYRYFKNQHGTFFRVHPDGRSGVLIGATWCSSNVELSRLEQDPYVRELSGEEVPS